MKMKSLAMLAFGTLTAASFLVATPALADDADNSMPSQNNATSTDNSGSSNNGSSSSSDSSTNNSSDSNSGSSDEASPDTATGDDDY
ncbi:MAG: hypothetical protein WAW86_01590 [Gammaproteobacteria bacterium]